MLAILPLISAAGREYRLNLSKVVMELGHCYCYRSYVYRRGYFKLKHIVFNVRSWQLLIYQDTAFNRDYIFYMKYELLQMHFIAVICLPDISRCK